MVSDVPLLEARPFVPDKVESPSLHCRHRRHRFHRAVHIHQAGEFLAACVEVDRVGLVVELGRADRQDLGAFNLRRGGGRVGAEQLQVGGRGVRRGLGHVVLCGGGLAGGERGKAGRGQDQFPGMGIRIRFPHFMSLQMKSQTPL